MPLQINLSKFTFLFFLNFLLIISCDKKKSEVGEEKLERKKYSIQKNEVDIAILEQTAFQKELVSNGKLRAIQKNVLKFEVSERLEKLNVKNGDIVKKGQSLAVLKTFKFQQKLEKAKSTYKKAELDLKDQLLGRGYNLDIRDSIPKDIYEMLVIRSGYGDAIRNLESVKEELRAAELKAPFKGKVANLKSKKYEQISAGRDFMTLIDDSVFEVEFYLIESEIADVHINDKVQVIPFALGTTYKGKITSINPEVGKNGTILVKAAVRNNDRLIEGMNVKVLIQKAVPDQFVVPKTAVVLRQNQEVLFKVVNGHAFWTYVITTKENSDSYAVIPHPDKTSAVLTPGDSIITSGNLNLAHDTEIHIKKSKK